LFVRTWPLDSPNNQAPIVLLHDSLGSVELWRDFPAQLSARTGRQVVAYDRLGFGKSDPYPEARLPFEFIENEAEVYLPAVLRHLDVQRFTLFGHSVGGGMAVVCAARSNGMCEAAIAESAQAFVEDRTVQGVTDGRNQFEDEAKLARLAKYQGPKARWVVDAWTGIWLSPAFADWSLKAELPKVRCPLLAIHGDRDEFGSIRHPEMMCKYAGGPSEMKVLENCGHVPHREQAAAVLDLVANFLS